MNLEQIYRFLQGRWKPEKCMEKVAGIWENDRFFTRDRFHKTAAFCADSMKKAGLSQVELLPLKADGKTRYFDWQMPICWEAEEATLCYEDGELILDRREMPCCLATYCPSTPVGGVEAEVVIPTRDDPDPEKYRGKMLLVAETVSKWTSFAQEHGAVGILSDYITLFPGVRNSREDLYDECIWLGMDYRATVFGMHLTPRKADRLRQQLQEGPVRLRANIRTRTYEGISYTVSGALEGEDPSLPEVLVYGHLYEPGANDNASGTGAILYAAELLAAAVAQGSLPRPRRTIRFVMGDECWGSMGYLALHPERRQLCGMVADMIGTELVDRAVMSLCYDPAANWSFADGALYALAQIAGRNSGAFASVDDGFAVGTDNIMADPCFGMPTVALVASPALSYHSSMDRMDRIEPATLTRNGLIMASYIYGIAGAEENMCRELEEAIRKQIKERAEKAVHPRQRIQLQQMEQRALCSLNRLVKGYYIPETAVSEEEMPDYAKEDGHRIPERLVLGALTHRGEYNGKKYKTAWNGNLTIPCCWADGKRNLWQIAWQAAVEKGNYTDEAVKEEFFMLRDYFTMLSVDGYVRWLGE